MSKKNPVDGFNSDIQQERQRRKNHEFGTETTIF